MVEWEEMVPAYHSTANYTATLTHKVNHSFVPNCRWSNMEHPCYGLTPAILTLQAVAQDEELTAHYHLNMEEGGEGASRPQDAPEWYLESWRLSSPRRAP